MKFTASQQQFLNVLIKVNVAKLEAISLPARRQKQLFAQPISKLLIARLKDTGVLYSFFVSLHLIAQ